MSHTESTLWIPTTDAEKELVRQQMNRLLETHHFRNSRRYPALFRFIIEETLNGRGEFLKERLLGVQVFGRPADYDTASDPVVRVTVAEIRKRIAQYYHDEAHDHEMRIELLPGGYEPEFRTGRHPEQHDAALNHAEPVHPAPSHSVSDVPFVAAKRISHTRWYMSGAVIAVLIAVGSMYVWQVMHPSALDEFWAPITASSNHTVILCLPVAGGKYGAAADSELSPTGEIRPIPTAISSQPKPTTYLALESLGENVVFSDVLALSRVSDVVATHHAQSRYLLNTAVTLDDLRQGPSVLIGALDNQWTLRALEQLRYQFGGSRLESYWIVDTKTGKQTPWSMDLKTPIGSVTRDYGIVARIHDQATGQIEVLIGGIGMTGTAAAGELLTDPALIEGLRKKVGPGFHDHNFEAVISTDVVNGSAGAPKILTIAVE
jgi:hypothetical protein